MRKKGVGFGAYKAPIRKNENVLLLLIKLISKYFLRSVVQMNGDRKKFWIFHVLLTTAGKLSGSWRRLVKAPFWTSLWWWRKKNLHRLFSTRPVFERSFPWLLNVNAARLRCRASQASNKLPTLARIDSQEPHIYVLDDRRYRPLQRRLHSRPLFAQIPQPKFPSFFFFPLSRNWGRGFRLSSIQDGLHPFLTPFKIKISNLNTLSSLSAHLLAYGDRYNRIFLPRFVMHVQLIQKSRPVITAFVGFGIHFRDFIVSAETWMHKFGKRLPLGFTANRSWTIWSQWRERTKKKTIRRCT